MPGSSCCWAHALVRAESFTVVLPGEPGVSLRLHVEVGGEPLLKKEADFLRDWFRFCDVQGTGKLDGPVIRRALRYHPLLQLVPSAQVEPGDLGLDGSAAVTITDLVARYQRQPRGRLLWLEAPPAVPPYADLLTQALGRCLDRDGDGRLSRTELESAERVLLEAFDLDGDECLTPLEIVPDLLNSIAPGPVGRLTRPVVLLPGEAETKREPGLELLVRLGAGQARVFTAQSRASADVRWQSKQAGLLLDVQAIPAGGAFLASAPAKMKSRTELLRLFQQADPSKRGWVLLNDLKGRELYPLRLLHRPADRGGDGRLTVMELEQYLALRDRAAEGLVTLAVLPRQRGWFELLDHNRDGRLGRRELPGPGSAGRFRSLDLGLHPSAQPESPRLQPDADSGAGTGCRAGPGTAAAAPSRSRLVPGPGPQRRRRPIVARVCRNPRAVPLLRP